jgi:transposase-like protein
MRKFSDEFKSEAVRLVFERKLPVSHVVKDLGIGCSTLEKWLNQRVEPQILS